MISDKSHQQFFGEIVTVKHLNNDMHLMTIKGHHKGRNEDIEIDLTFGPLNNFIAKSYKGQYVQAAYLFGTSQMVGLCAAARPASLDTVRAIPVMTPAPVLPAPWPYTQPQGPATEPPSED